MFDLYDSTVEVLAKGDILTFSDVDSYATNGDAVCIRYTNDFFDSEKDMCEFFEDDEYGPPDYIFVNLVTFERGWNISVDDKTIRDLDYLKDFYKDNGHLSNVNICEYLKSSREEEELEEEALEPALTMPRRRI